jgi:hypothetical protein
MKKINFIFCFSILLFSVSCKQSDQDIESSTIKDGIKKIAVKKEADWLVILPGMGCPGCIQDAEAFMRDNVANPRLMFVLTKIESLKLLKQKIGVDVTTIPNVYVDKDNIFDVHTTNAIYPCIVRLSAGEPGEHQFQSPKNSQALEKLQLKLAQK